MATLEEIMAANAAVNGTAAPPPAAAAPPGPVSGGQAPSPSDEVAVIGPATLARWQSSPPQAPDPSLTGYAAQDAAADYRDYQNWKAQQGAPSTAKPSTYAVVTPPGSTSAAGGFGASGSGLTPAAPAPDSTSGQPSLGVPGTGAPPGGGAGAPVASVPDKVDLANAVFKASSAAAQGGPGSGSGSGRGGAQAGPAAASAPAVAAASPPAVGPASAAPAGSAPDSPSPAPPGGSSDPAPAPAAASGKKTGLVANIGAGLNQGLTGTLGLPVDAATALLNLVPKGINAATGTNLPTIQNPMGGSQWLNSALGLVGADPRDVVANGSAQRIARGAAAGVAGAVLPLGIAGQVARLAGAAGMPIAQGVSQALAAPSALSAAGAGAAAGAAGEGASDVVAEPYKPIANVLGQLVGGGIGAAGESALGSLTRGGLDAGASMLAPISSKLPGTPSALRPQALRGADGSALLDGSGRPITGTSGQFGLAAKQLASAAGTSRSALSDLIPAPADAELVPGSQPTLGQATGNTGVLNLENRIGGTKAGRAAFTDRRTANNTAQANALRNIEDPDVHSGAAARFFSQHAAAIDADADKAIGRAQRQADRDTADFGRSTEAQSGADLRARVERRQAPDLARAREAEAAGRDRVATADEAVGTGGSSRQAVGQSIRDAVTNAVGGSKARIDKLYKALDPNGTWAIPATAAKAAVRQVRQELDPEGGLHLSAAEQHWSDVIGGWKGTVRWSALSQARQGIGEAVRTAMRSGTPSEVRQLQMMKAGIDASIDQAVAARAEVEAPHVVAGSLKQDNSLIGRAASHAAQEQTAVYTPAGRRVDVQHEVVDASKLTTSHNADLSPNPTFPSQLQPRDRTRAASELQIARMSRNLQPERLGASSSAIEGAPIVGPDGVVESGNARTLAVRRAYAENGPSGQAYRAWVASHGVDISGMKEPMLVRRRTTDLSPEDRQRFTEEANASPALSMGAAERAKVDGARLSDETIAKMVEGGGDVGSASNRTFARSAVRDIAAPGEEGSMAAADGSLSMEGARRIRNALLSKAYGDPDLVASLTETDDENVRAFGSALTDAAGPMARLRSAVKAGEVDPSMDISPALVEAAHLVGTARAKGMRLADVVGQQDAFSRVSKEAEEVLRAAYGQDLSGRLARGRLADYLKDYISNAEQQSTAPRLFGENAAPQELLRQAGARYGRSESGASGGYASSDQSQGAASSRAGGGADGSQARGYGNGPGRSGADSSRTSSDGRSRDQVLAGDPLAPDFTAENAEEVANARHTRLEHQIRFAGAPAAIAKRATDGREFAIEPSEVPGRAFRSVEGAQQLVQAVGQDEAERLAGEYVPYDLRSRPGAVLPDGTLDPAKLRAWLSSRSEILDVFPGLRARFDTLAKAQAQLSDLTAQRQAIEKQNPAARLDGDAQAFNRYWRPGPRGEEAVQDYLRDTGGSVEDVRVLADGAASSLRAAAVRDGEFNRRAYDSWMSAHARALDAAPAEVKAKLSSFGRAQEAVEDVQAVKVEQVRQYQDSAARFYIDRTGGDADPYRSIARLLGSSNPNHSALDLMNLARSDPAAVQGIRRNLIDYIVAKATTTAEAGATEERMLSRAPLARILNDPAQEPAIRRILEPDQVEQLQAVLQDMDRAARSVNVPKIPGSPGTAADMAAQADHGGGHGGTMRQILFMGLAEQAAEHVGGLHEGGVAGMVMKGAAFATPFVANAVRSVGLRRVDDLVTAAVLHPEVGRALLDQPARTAAQRVALGAKLSRLSGLLAVSGASQVAAPRLRETNPPMGLR